MKILLACGFTSCIAAQAMPSGTIFDIRSGPAATSLKEFATQAHLQLLFDFKAVEKLKTRAVRGQLTPAEALQEMLKGSGFTFHEINDHTIAIARQGGSTSSFESQQQGSPPSTDDKKAGKTESFYLGSFQAQEEPVQSSSAATVERKAEPLPLPGVIVTAEKSSGNLLTVPVPVTALQASDLQNYNQLRVQDYFSQVPGLQFAPNEDVGSPQLAIRGIIAGQGLNPTIGVTVDGVPYGSSTSAGGGNVIPDFDPSDLARVEVLRGPQGTLYGANSLGGQIQFVTVEPSTDDFSGKVSAGASDVQDGVGAGYNTRAAVNIPITDEFAVRASGFTRRDPGYINDLTNGVDGVNERNVYGGHFAALWTPTDNFKAKFSAIFEHIEQFGSDYADVLTPPQNLDQLTQSGRVLNTGLQNDRFQNYSLTLDYKFSTFDLTSISSYNQNNRYERLDESELSYVNPCVFPTLAHSYYGPSYNGCYTQPVTPPAAGTTQIDKIFTRKYTQELRLTTPLGKYVDWLFGIFYTKEISDFFNDFEAANTQTGASLATQGVDTVSTTLRDEAVFTDFTFKINQRFDVQVGGRANIDRQHFIEDLEGGVYSLPDYPIRPGLSQPIGSKFTSYTYLLTPRYFLLKDGPNTVMTYARFASGFRPGGPNGFFGTQAIMAGIPLTYGPDKTYNYDLGIKAALLDRRLTLDISLFYIDWRNIQVTTQIDGNGVAENGARARSDGVEFQAEVRPLKGLTVGANFTYDDARLIDGISPITFIVGNAGDRLPYSAQYTGSLDVNQDFPIPFGSGLRGFVGAQLSYVGARFDFFSFGTLNPDMMTLSPNNPRQEYPAYAQVNLRAGVSYSTWSAEVYATNVAGRRGLLSGGPNDFPQTNGLLPFYYITPRTVGFEITETF